MAALFGFALQTGCLQPVTEGRDAQAKIETMFVVPISDEAMGTLGVRFWAHPFPQDTDPYIGPAFLRRTERGELLIDHLGGALLPDGRFLPPPLAWRAEQAPNHFSDGWQEWRGVVYRTSSGYTSDDFTFWRFSKDAQSLVRERSISGGLDGGIYGSSINVKSTHGRDGGTQLCVGAYPFGSIPQDGGLAPGNLRLFDSPDDTSPQTLSESVGGSCQGSASDQTATTYLVRLRPTLWSIVRLNEQGVANESLPVQADCVVPRESASSELQFICQAGTNLNFWRTEGRITRLTKTVQLPEGARLAVFVRAEPLLYLRTQQSPDQDSTVIEVCSLNSCSELLAVSHWPPAIGVVDSDMLVADFIADAGVRLRKIPAKIWNQQ